MHCLEGFKDHLEIGSFSGVVFRAAYRLPLLVQGYCCTKRFQYRHF